MSTPAAQVVPIFATPFGVVTLPDAATLNAALAALFTARTTPQWREATGGPGALTFRSRDDLLESEAEEAVMIEPVPADRGDPCPRGGCCGRLR